MRLTWISVQVVLVAGVLLAGCGTTDATNATTTPGGTDRADGSWELVSGTGPGGVLRLVDGFPVTLEIDGDQVGGTACNHYSATLTRDGDSVRIGRLGGTDMACRDDVMALEAAFHEAMHAVDTIERAGDELVLSGPDVELRFAELPPVPTADLVGTTWTLESIVVGETVASVAGEPATLTLAADGSLTGSTGCRQLTGRYVESTGEIVATDLAADGECPDDLRDQDAHIIDVLADGFRASVDGDALTLTSNGGLGLVYRAA